MQRAGTKWFARLAVLAASTAPVFFPLPAHASRTSGAPAEGIVVESVEAGGAAQAAGLQAGDVLSGWRRVASPAGAAHPNSHAFTSPFDWLTMEVDDYAAGAVELRVVRDGTHLAVTLPPGALQAQVGPRLTAAQAEAAAALRAQLEAVDAPAVADPAARVSQAGIAGSSTGAWILYRAGIALTERGSDRAPVVLRAALAQARAIKSPATEAWLWHALGDALHKLRDTDGALAAHQRALALRSAPRRGLPAAASLARLGAIAWASGRRESAAAWFDEAFRLREALAPESLDFAGSCNNLGVLAGERGELDAARDWHTRALAIRERLAPGSRILAGSYNNLAAIAHQRGDLAGAEEGFRKAVAIWESVAPGTSSLASGYTNLGVISRSRGDLAAAEAWGLRALALRESLAPGSLEVAAICNNLALVAAQRGDYTAAEAWHRRDLAISETLAPSSAHVASAYNNLGILARARGDLDTAEAWYRRSLEVMEAIAPRTLRVASAYNNLAVVAWGRGDYAAAETWLMRDLEITAQAAPDSLILASCVNNLAALRLEAGDKDAAETGYTRALEIRERLAPGSLEVALSCHNLGALARSRGRLEEAERWLRRALEIAVRRAPGSTDHCDSAWELARVLAAGAREEEAVRLFGQAVAALEDQQARLGGSPDNLAAFRAGYQGLYREYAALLVRLGRGVEAFRVLESSRARAMLALLAERDLSVHGAPEELERERRLANADASRILVELGGLPDGPDGADARAELEQELGRIRLRQETVRAGLRAAAPSLAQLRYPEPMDLRAAQAALPRGVLLLAWMPCPSETLLFAVTADRFEAASIPVGAQELERHVRRLRAMAQDPAAGAAEVRAAARPLGALLEPAAGLLRSAERLVVAPEGALWLLPFALLGDPARPERFLGHRLPLSATASMTLLAQLGTTGAAAGPTTVCAAGDPAYPPGSPWPRLPGARREVEALARLYGPAVTAWLGADATEARMRTLPGGAILHVAAHGSVDARFPLESSLVMSLPEGAEGADPATDGQLRAWEIFEGLSFDYGLVTLSACDTALGKDVAGEGIVGLSRAFHYAGARAVLMTLWSVNDESTAVFMEHFYRRMKAGDPKDVALLKARRALSKDPRTAHPFHWAPFLLSGRP